MLKSTSTHLSAPDSSLTTQILLAIRRPLLVLLISLPQLCDKLAQAVQHTLRFVDSWCVLGLSCWNRIVRY